MKRKSESDHAAGTNGSNPKRILLESDVAKHFRPGLFDRSVLAQYTEEYAQSDPYKHGVIPSLIEGKLLRNVRDEIRANISFTPKDTDIYKIYQSGDLANLDGLDDSSLKLLPSLVTLRDALYSAPFRTYLSTITNAGPLSGSKTDMAVNVYTPGCHLLCHDDVIGTRRVSYILYLTDPDRPWQPEWGGGLRLYPTETMQDADGTEAKVPSAEFAKIIPPAFGQLAYFAVQPGESFHDVEEVYARHADDAADDGGRIRMAISGWYHIPQPGEEGFEEGAEAQLAENSSLAQLQGKANKYDRPQPQWIAHRESIPVKEDTRESQEDEQTDLTEADLDFLLRFMNPRYLVPDTVAELAQTFSEDSSLRLALFLSDKFSAALHAAIMKTEEQGTDRTAWSIARPPHKHRFLYQQPGFDISENDSDLLNSLINELLPSLAFKKWLGLATALTLNESNALVRRFRRGVDYTLATTYEEEEPRLEICLGLTPTKGWTQEDLEVEAPMPEAQGLNGGSKQHGSEVQMSGALQQRSEPESSDKGVGGYEVYIAGDDDAEGDDKDSEHDVMLPSSHTGAGQRKEKPDPAVYRAAAGNDDEDEGILFSMPPAWNTLGIVLRDKGVLRFVKYVSRSAPGDRWDVAAEWRVEPDDSDASGDEESEEGEVSSPESGSD